MVRFQIPGLNILPQGRLELQSWVLAPHAGGAILMIAGGNAGGVWPRAGNRPVYFWLDLRTGASRRLPIGWDLYCCTSNQMHAVFANNSGTPDEHPGFPLIDLKSGARTANIEPKDLLQYSIPFDWTQKDRPRQLIKTGPMGYATFAGLVIDGVTYPINLPVSMGGTGWFADAREGWAAFGWRGGNDPSCWIGALLPGANQLCMGTNVIYFELLEAGRCVCVTKSRDEPVSGQGAHWTVDGWYVDGNTRRAWNILDGIAGASPPQEAISQGVNTMTVRLTRGVGRSGSANAVLCRFSQIRSTSSAFNSAGYVPNWEAAILVTADGRRYVLEGLSAGGSHEVCWFHNRGTLVLGGTHWQDSNNASDSTSERAPGQEFGRIHLTDFELSENTELRATDPTPPNIPPNAAKTVR